MKLDYYVITWANKIYKMSEDECENFADSYTKANKLDLILLPSGGSITKAVVQYVGHKKDAPYVEDKSYTPPEPKHEDSGYLPVSTLFLTGEVSGAFDQSKKIKIMAKKIWFEHVKRRPMLNNLHKLNDKFSGQELRIIETPLDQLMADYEKSISTPTTQG